MTHPQLLLLGLGNDILCDDAVGLRVVRVLRERFKNCPNLVVAETTEMGLALLDLIVGFDPLVVVDAIQTGQCPAGFVHEFNGSDLNTLPAISPHFLGVGEALALGRELGLAVPNCIKIFAIEVRDPFQVSEILTPEIELALPSITERVMSELRLHIPLLV